MAKALPFESSKGFIAVPHAISLYVRHPWFTPSAERLYRYLLSRHNDDYGYAWPTWAAMERETGLSRGSIKTCLDHLEHLGLITRRKHAKEVGFANNIYTFNALVEEEDAFERKFRGEIDEIKKGKIRNLREYEKQKGAEKGA